MELYFLGTGAGLPSKERNVSSIALQLLQEQQSIWLFDCGEATQHQILHTAIKPRKINKIFITHMHGDHIYGLPGLLSSRSFQSGTSPVTVYGPAGLKDFIQTSLRVSGTSLAYPLYIEEVFEGLILENERFQVFCKKLDHGLSSFGYRVVEKDQPGQLLPEKLKEAGITPGPIYQQIKTNPEIKLESGETIYRSDFIGPDKPGKIVTILGDTRYLPELAEFVNNSNVLVHEATFSESEEELAYNYYHSTTLQAAKLAKSGNVKRLILTHISSRYQGDSKNDLLSEARSVFPNAELADDFYHTAVT
ncbi:ribonuclease Z [Sediminibacillus massiliensis]|uniref:ribonuclease Z n=1 Tax=Sediminibacillus massiliensis TaxID=1926277 RepID=UPI0009885D0C|nr:ribonuclease Z [Sediminibacillus massiliensis]